MKALANATEPLSRNDLQVASGLRDRVHFLIDHLRPMLAGRLIELTIPDRPRSSRQRYRLTEAGRKLLAQAERSEAGHTRKQRPRS